MISVRSDGKPKAILNHEDKIHVITAKVTLPCTACDDDGTECVSGKQIHSYKPIGIAFAGSHLVFTSFISKFEKLLSNLGLKAIYNSNNKYKETILTLSPTDRASFSINEWIDGELFIPPPQPRVALYIEAAKTCLNDVLTELNSNEQLRSQSILGEITTGYSLEIAIIANCEHANRPKVVKITWNEKIEHKPDTSPHDYPLSIQHTEYDQLLLLGSRSHHKYIRNLIRKKVKHAPKAKNKLINLTNIIQPLIEEIIKSSKINKQEIQGVGGKIQRGILNTKNGFRKLDSEWNMCDEDRFSVDKMFD